jgi:hypothetical protein
LQNGICQMVKPLWNSTSRKFAFPENSADLKIAFPLP